jgi:hypothetical protein
LTGKHVSSLSSLSFSKLFVQSLWLSLIEFKSSFSPSHGQRYRYGGKIYEVLAKEIRWWGLQVTINSK